MRFGAGNLRGAFWTVDVLEGAGTGQAYQEYIHFDYKPPHTEDVDDVWETARACMRNYLILRERVRAFRADPEVKDALGLLGSPNWPYPPSPTARRWQTYELNSTTSRPLLRAACTSNDSTNWPWST